jgi:hypothetical protein
VVRAAASRCPSRNSAQNRARDAIRRVLSLLRFRSGDAAIARPHTRRIVRASTCQRYRTSLDPNVVGWTPAARVTRVARGKDRLTALQIADESPGLARERLVERMGMPGLRRNGPATLRAHGAQRRIRLGAKRAASSRQRSPLAVYRRRPRSAGRPARSEGQVHGERPPSLEARGPTIVSPTASTSSPFPGPRGAPGEH